MKQSVKCFALTMALASVAVLAHAQPDERDKKNDKEVQQIIITNKGDKDKKEKMTIVIDGDNVTVNGKPVDEYKGDGVTIRKSRVMATAPGTFSWGNGQNNLALFGERDNNRAMLGVVTEALDDEKGVEITDITEESAAEKAGLKEGDIILKIDDKNIENPDDLSEEIRKHKPGDKVTVTYKRDKKEQKVQAELGKWKGGFESFNFSQGASPFSEMEIPMLEELARTPRALTIPRNFNRTMPDQNFRYYWFDDRPRLGISVQDTDDGKGVKVIEVDEEGTAAKAGIKTDDIITHINDKEVNSADEISKLVKENKDKASVRFQLKREGKSQNIEVKMPRKLKTADL